MSQQLFLFPTCIVFRNEQTKYKAMLELKAIVKHRLISAGYKRSTVLTKGIYNDASVLLVGIMPDKSCTSIVLRDALLSAFHDALGNFKKQFALEFQVYEYAVKDINDISLYRVLFNDALCRASEDLEKFRRERKFLSEN